jgi:hypothetical protein
MLIFTQPRKQRVLWHLCYKDLGMSRLVIFARNFLSRFCQSSSIHHQFFRCCMQIQCICHLSQMDVAMVTIGRILTSSFKCKYRMSSHIPADVSFHFWPPELFTDQALRLWAQIRFHQFKWQALIPLVSGNYCTWHYVRKLTFQRF